MDRWIDGQTEKAAVGQAVFLAPAAQRCSGQRSPHVQDSTLRRPCFEILPALASAFPALLGGRCVCLKVRRSTPESECEQMGAWVSGDSPRYHLSMAGAAGCVLGGRERRGTDCQGPGWKVQTTSLHTSAGRKGQSRGGGAGEGALTSCLPASRDGLEPGSTSENL